MHIKERVVGGVTVLALSGRIVLGEGDVQVKDRIRSLLAEGQKKIVLNLAGVEVKEDDTMVVTLNDGAADGSFIADVLVKNSFKLKMLKEEEIDLEDVFMGITKGITN